MKGSDEMDGKKYTEAGTDIEEVKRLNAESGPSYNEIMRMVEERYAREQQNTEGRE